jgi:hypothetical protein
VGKTDAQLVTTQVDVPRAGLPRAGPLRRRAGGS